MDFTTVANQKTLEKVVLALKANGVNGIIVQNAQEAKNKVFELLPKDAEVMTMSSVTLSETGMDKEINESGKYDSVKQKLLKLDRATQSAQMQKLGAAPSWAIGSIHAVTEDGTVVVASNTGSQLAAYTYGAQNVIWVVGGQKIVKDQEEALKRVYDYVLPLESERLQKIHGVGSYVSKLFILHKEIVPNRITLILIKEKLGF